MSAAKPPRKRKDEKPSDFAILGGPTEDGQGAHLLRFREGSVSAGEIRPVREGEPVTHKELVRLHPMDVERRICRVETLHEPPPEAAAATAEKTSRPDGRDPAAERSSRPEGRDPAAERSSRPVRVSNERYRKNWDKIFDSKGTRPKPDWDVN
ncbi:MAG TPA: hypothetical protein VJV78_23835 [Polyangiales bacterium]|nr:hypothetical protein [Polyangiales bacterium]